MPAGAGLEPGRHPPRRTALGRGLLEPPLSRRAFVLVSMRVLAAPTLFLLSIPVALVSPSAATYTWLLVWPVTTVLARLGRALLREARRIEAIADL